MTSPLRAGKDAQKEPELTPAQVLATFVRLAEEQRSEREKRRLEKLARRAEEDARLAMEKAHHAEEEAQRAEEEAKRAVWRARQAREDAMKAAEKARLAREEATRVPSPFKEYSPATPEDSDSEECPPAQQFPLQQPPQLQQENGKSDSVTCYFCHKVGHKKKECRKKNKLCLCCGSADHKVAACPKLPPNRVRA